MKGLKRIIFLSLLVSLGLVLGLFEAAIPLAIAVPGAKLGLSNIVILTSLTILGFKEALLVAILKSVILSLVTGSVTSLFYSLSGAVCSCILMELVYKNFSNIFSLIGVSIFGAVGHNFAQVAVASLILNNIKIFHYYPILIITALFTGYFVGLTSNYLNKHIEENFERFIDIR